MNYKNFIKINIDNLKYNISYLKNNYKYNYYILNVSNNAFNHGMYLINYLNEEIDYLYVNNLNDINVIRKFNNNIPIIFDGNWYKDNILDFINKDVILVINDIKELEEINNNDLYDKFNIILNIDVNGLLGFNEKLEIKKASEIIKNNNKLELLGIKSQLSVKDYAKFLYLISPLQQTEIKLSILNNEDDKNKIKDSNAILIDKSIYGMNNIKNSLFSKEEKHFKQIFELHSKIINIKKEIKGKKEKIYAIIPYGLLNGMNEKINKVWINNNHYNIIQIKNKFMIVLVDNNVKIDDEVLIIGCDNPLENYIYPNTLLYFSIFNTNLPIIFNDYSLEKMFVY